MKNTLYILIMMAILLSSCSPSPSPNLSMSQLQSLEYWDKRIKINPETFESDAHNAYVDIYVNSLAKEAYEKRLAVYPVGAEVIKPLYKNKYKEGLARVVFMIKMQKGYDAKNGDWWYGVTDPTGKELWYEGRVQHCIDCHVHAKETDYMFSESVMEEIEIQKGLRGPEVYFEEGVFD